MQGIAIPKEMTKGEELVVIPRALYERVMRLLEKQDYTARTRLDHGLKEALTDVEVGRVIGPFSTLSAGLKALKKAK